MASVWEALFAAQPIVKSITAQRMSAIRVRFVFIIVSPSVSFVRFVLLPPQKPAPS
jgi:hypothetical protein